MMAGAQRLSQLSELMGQLAGQVLFNALAMTGLANFRVVGKSETIANTDEGEKIPPFAPRRWGTRLDHSI